MNISKHLISVFVLPSKGEHQNVICRVVWMLRFEEDGHQSDALVETILPTDNISDFVPANEVGNERVLEWAYNAQGGEALVAELSPYHTDQINYAKLCVGHVPFTDGFVLPAPVERPTMPSAVL